MSGPPCPSDLEPLESAAQLPVSHRGIIGSQLNSGVVGVVADDVLTERLGRDLAVLPHTLRDALDLWQHSEIATEAFGKDVVAVRVTGVGGFQRQLMVDA